MMFMEIISLKIIIGHRVQQDGGINYITLAYKLIPYQLLQMVRVIWCIGLLDN